MSIAVSVVVNPSRFLLAAVGAMCIGITSFAAMIGTGHIGELSMPMRLLTAGSCTVTAFSAFYWVARTRKTFRIDISDIGQIRLEEYIGSGKFSLLADGAKSSVVTLMPDSTIWPHLLLLRLRGEDDQIKVLPILGDCIENDAFRTLSIACRWIAAQSIRAENQKI
jgi:toxin CptA